MQNWEEMVVRAQNGDLDAFGNLVRHFQDMAVAYAYSILGDFDLAEDAAQEAFIQVYRDLATLQEAKAFPAWFRRVVFTKCSRMIRGKRIRTVPMDTAQYAAHEVASRDAGPAKAAQQREMQQAVLEAIRALPENERAVTSLFYINGYSMAEVGEFLEVPVPTVKRRLHSARAKLRERMTNMVEQTLKQNAPGDDFSKKIRRILSDVPVLDWSRGKTCTAMGAFEAAMSVTEHPYRYTDLMGFSGMAFRIRWSNSDTTTGFCGSCPVGEMPEEMSAVMKATGWTLPTDFHFYNPNPDYDAIWAKVVASINAGRPVAAYDDKLDMAVIYGYEDEGRVVLFRDYYKGDTPHPLPVSQIGPMQVYLGEHHQPSSTRDSFTESLRMAVRSWRRGKSDGGIPHREYLDGELAFRTWIDDLSRADAGDFSDENMGRFYHQNAWVFVSMVDARAAARDYLREHAGLMEGAQGEHVERAAALYEEELAIIRIKEPGSMFFGPHSGRPIADWTSAVREREREVLKKAFEIERRAMGELEKALE